MNDAERKAVLVSARRDGERAANEHVHAGMTPREHVLFYLERPDLLEGQGGVEADALGLEGAPRDLYCAEYIREFLRQAARLLK